MDSLIFLFGFFDVYASIVEFMAIVFVSQLLNISEAAIREMLIS